MWAREICAIVSLGRTVAVDAWTAAPVAAPADGVRRGGDALSKHDFETVEFLERQARVRSAMENAGIDLLLVISPINVNYLIGARGKIYQFFRCLFFPADGPTTFLIRLPEVAETLDLSLADEVRGWGGREPEDPIEAFRAILAEKGWSNRRIGLEVPDYHLHPRHYEQIKAVLGASLVMDASRLVEELKFVKSPAEIAYIRKAAAIADAGIETFRTALRVGRTEFEVVADVHRTLMALGSDAPPSPMNFGTGERTAYAHALPSERRLQRGDFVNAEYGASWRRYCSTIGRQFCMGEPTARMREIYAVVREACDACIAEMRPGVACRVPHAAAKQVIAAAGWDAYRVHTTGYGIAPGFPPAWGESIQMTSDSPYVLEPGMVLSVEPPVYIHEERLGARLIDNVLITEQGPEILSRASRGMIIAE